MVRHPSQYEYIEETNAEGWAELLAWHSQQPLVNIQVLLCVISRSPCNAPAKDAKA